MPEQDGEAYAYDLPHAQPEQGDCWEFTYDHLGRLTEVRHIGEDRCRRANFLANASG
jgi:hypothetical protein